MQIERSPPPERMPVGLPTSSPLRQSAPCFQQPGGSTQGVSNDQELLSGDAGSGEHFRFQVSGSLALSGHISGSHLLKHLQEGCSYCKGLKEHGSHEPACFSRSVLVRQALGPKDYPAGRMMHFWSTSWPMGLPHGRFPPLRHP